MNGEALVVAVRQVLKDTESLTQKGEFWDDRQIVLALNMAQSMFVNFCVRQELMQFLGGLITEFTYRYDPADYPATLPSAADPAINDSPQYLHYLSGSVGIYSEDEGINELREARVFLGTHGAASIGDSVDAVIIIGNNIYFQEDGNPEGSGRLLYYRQPSWIGVRSLGHDLRDDYNRMDFDFAVYDDYIVSGAVSLLGKKEGQQQRDYKKHLRDIGYLSLQPPFLLRLIRDNDRLKRYAKMIERQGGGI